MDGEPTEYKGLAELLRIAKENKIYNKLVTNASNFENEKLDDIIKNLDEITFSIDFVDDNLNEQVGRGKNYFSHIKNVINYITLRYPNCVLSINTIVMKQNLNLLEDIYNAINKFKLRRWKLIQFCSFRGIAAENKESFSITKEEYMEALHKCQKMQCDFEIKGHTAYEVENNHIIVTSAGVILGA